MYSLGRPACLSVQACAVFVLAAYLASTLSAILCLMVLGPYGLAGWSSYLTIGRSSLVFWAGVLGLWLALPKASPILFLQVLCLAKPTFLVEPLAMLHTCCTLPYSTPWLHLGFRVSLYIVIGWPLRGLPSYLVLWCPADGHCFIHPVLYPPHVIPSCLWVSPCMSYRTLLLPYGCLWLPVAPSGLLSAVCGASYLLEASLLWSFVMFRRR